MLLADNTTQAKSSIQPANKAQAVTSRREQARKVPAYLLSQSGLFKAPDGKRNNISFNQNNVNSNPKENPLDNKNVKQAFSKY